MIAGADGPNAANGAAVAAGWAGVFLLRILHIDGGHFDVDVVGGASGESWRNADGERGLDPLTACLLRMATGKIAPQRTFHEEGGCVGEAELPAFVGGGDYGFAEGLSILDGELEHEQRLECVAEFVEAAEACDAGCIGFADELRTSAIAFRG